MKLSNIFTALPFKANKFIIEHLLNIQNYIDYNVQNYECLDEKFLLELKDKMLFAYYVKDSSTEDLSIYGRFINVIINKTIYENFILFDYINIGCIHKLPIFYNFYSSVNGVAIKNGLQNNEYDFTNSFSKVIELLNINNFDYYKKFYKDNI